MNFKLHDAFPADIHDLLIVVDAMFEPVDGEKLFDVIEEMDRYSAANHGNDLYYLLFFYASAGDVGKLIAIK